MTKLFLGQLFQKYTTLATVYEKEPYEENICFLKKYILFQKTYTFFKNICYSYVLLENICLTYVIVPLCAARAQGAAHKGPAITSNIGQIYA